jgi:hypothetical protein
MSVESFHTQHAPIGAFASFTVGLVGSPGGFGHALKGPAKQNVYVGARSADGGWDLLPFFIPARTNASAFTGEAGAADAGDVIPLRPLSPDQYTRTLGLASDRWEAGRLSFVIHTPFRKVPDPQGLDAAQGRACYAPVITAELSYDNSQGTEAVELVFGISESDLQLYPIFGDTTGIRGFAASGRFGFATAPADGLSLKQGFSVFAPNPEDHRGMHVLGNEAALMLTVPAGQRRTLPIALGFYEGGPITTGMATRYAYTRWFASLEDVLAHGVSRHGELKAVSAERDAELAASRLDADQRFLVAQAVHSYYASSQLLLRGEEMVWVVNEGEYRMINTFDLTVDHVFFELAWHPWAVRNTLDLFVQRYSYTDRIRSTDGREAEGGVAFTHDMGVANHFTEPGRSSYECDRLHGCFSHMTMEQLLNWILTATCYTWKTGDWEWLRTHQQLLLDCVTSLENRDDPEDAKRTGLLKWDSERCKGGSEITTYDSLDVSLGQARNNLYLTGKALGAWLVLRQTFVRLGVLDAVARSERAIARVRAGLGEQFDAQAGFFPAVFEKGNRSHIIPAVEGLAYPLYLGMEADIAGCEPLLVMFERHLQGAFVRGVCLDAVSGGWKLSSTSRNTWFSKIALSQHVVRRLFPTTLNQAARAADKVHADWQRRPGCGAFAMCDQIFSDTGVTCGSRYYPRGVTTWLWLSE